MFEFRRQPLKTFYFLGFGLGVVCFRLPYWIIMAIITYMRPRRSWTMGRAITVAAMHAFVETWHAVAMPKFPGQDPEEIVKSGQAETVRFAWVPSISSELVAGEVEELAKRNGVAPQKTSGYWYTSPSFQGKYDEAAREDEKVVLHFHGDY